MDDGFVGFERTRTVREHDGLVGRDARARCSPRFIPDKISTPCDLGLDYMKQQQNTQQVVGNEIGRPFEGDRIFFFSRRCFQGRNNARYPAGVIALSICGTTTDVFLSASGAFHNYWQHNCKRHGKRGIASQ